MASVQPTRLAAADRPGRTGPTRAARAVAVAEHARLGPQVAAEVGQRVDDRLLHGVEGLPVDAVGEQRRLERVAPSRAGG